MKPTVERILLDGVPTLKITRGDYLVGYLQAGGWLGQQPSDTDLADLELA